MGAARLPRLRSARWSCRPRATAPTTRRWSMRCDSSDGRARGVATIRPSVTDDELHDMHDAGVRGVRFNFVKRLVDPKPDAYYRTLVERIAPLRLARRRLLRGVRPRRSLDAVHVARRPGRRRPHGTAGRRPGPRRRGVRPVPALHGVRRRRVEQGELPRPALGRGTAEVLRRPTVRAHRGGALSRTACSGVPTGRTRT